MASHQIVRTVLDQCTATTATSYYAGNLHNRSGIIATQYVQVTSVLLGVLSPVKCRFLDVLEVLVAMRLLVQSVILKNFGFRLSCGNYLRIE